MCVKCGYAIESKKICFHPKRKFKQNNGMIFDMLRTVHYDIFYNKNQQDALFLDFILVKNSTCFGQTCCPSSGISTLYTQQ